MLERVHKILMFAAPAVVALPAIAWLVAPERLETAYLVTALTSIPLVVAMMYTTRRMQVKEIDSPEQQEWVFRNFWRSEAVVLGVVNGAIITSLFGVAISNHRNFSPDDSWLYSLVVPISVVVAVVLLVVMTVGRDMSVVTAFFLSLSVAVPLLPSYLIGRVSPAGQGRRNSFLAAGSAIVAAIVFVAGGILSGGGSDAIEKGARYTGALVEINKQFPSEAAVAEGATEAPVKACANLVGSRQRPSLELVSCESGKPGYRIVQRVSTPAECPSDVDDRFYKSDGAKQWTACLDFAWPREGCLSIAEGAFSTWVECNDPKAVGAERATEILEDVTTVEKCPFGGFAHPLRGFAVCSETNRNR
jgi:hypothetical protein